MTNPKRSPGFWLATVASALLLGACSSSTPHGRHGEALAQPTTVAATAVPQSPTPDIVQSGALSPSSKLAKESTDEAKRAAEPLAPKALPPVNSSLLDNCKADRSIVISKKARRMELRCGEEVAARFGISLGFAPVGHKHHEGDGRTPEGTYYITTKFHSGFHRSLELSYPNIKDAERGLADGQISQVQRNHIVRAIRNCKRPPQTTPLGSLLQIHGGGGGEGVSDWTLGCVATNNPAIEAVYSFHRPGCQQDGSPRTPVVITP